MRKSLRYVTLDDQYLETFLFQIIKKYRSYYSEQSFRLLYDEIESQAPTLLKEWDFSGVDTFSLFQLPSLKTLVDLQFVKGFWFFSESSVKKELNKLSIEDRPPLFLNIEKSPHSNLIALKDVFSNLYIYSSHGRMLHCLISDNDTCEPINVVFYNRNWCWINLCFLFGERMGYNGGIIFYFDRGKLMPIMDFNEVEVSIVNNNDIALIRFLEEAKDHLNIKYLTEDQRNNIDFIKQAIDNKLLSEMELSIISDELKDDAALFEYAISQDMNYYPIFSDRLKENKHIAMNLLNHNPSHFFSLPLTLQKDKTFLLELLKDNGKFIDYLTVDLQQSIDFIHAAATTYQGALYYQFKYYPSSFKIETVEDCLVLLEADNRIFNLLEEKFKYNMQILGFMIVQDPSILRNIDAFRLKETDLCTLIERNPAAYLFCEACNNAAIALVACEKNPSLFAHINDAYKQDLDFVKKLLLRNPQVRHVLPSVLLNNKLLQAFIVNLADKDEDELPF
jgi:hypothetical protein